MHTWQNSLDIHASSEPHATCYVHSNPMDIWWSFYVMHQRRDKIWSLNVSSRCMHNVHQGWTNKVKLTFDHYVWIAQKPEASRVAHGFLKYVGQFPYCSFVTLKFVNTKSWTKTMWILLFMTFIIYSSELHPCIKKRYPLQATTILNPCTKKHLFLHIKPYVFVYVFSWLYNVGLLVMWWLFCRLLK